MRYQYALMLRVAQFCCLVIGLWASTATSARAQGLHQKMSAIPGPMLSQGTQQFETPDFKLILVKSSQTVAALNPKGAGDFDFTPVTFWSSALEMDIFIWETLLSACALGDPENGRTIRPQQQERR